MPFGKRAGGGRRDTTREQALVPAEIGTIVSSGVVVLVDLSRTGAKLCGSDLPPKDHDVVVRVGPVHAFGSIAWRNSDECGVTFDTSLTDFQVSQLRQHVRLARITKVTPEQKLAADDWANGLAR